MGRVGILSGSFDPVHQGHIAFCQSALLAGGLDKVVLLPEAAPRGKQQVTDLAHRVAMLELATKDSPQLEVLTLPGDQFSVLQTLPRLSAHFAGDELVLLVGSDVARTFAYRWPGLMQLFEAMEVMIGIREGDSEQELEAGMRCLKLSYPTVTIRYQFVAADPYAHAASSRVRAATHSANELLPHISEYIAAHRLYRRPAPQ